MNKLPFGHPAWIEINLQQFKNNIKIIQQHLGQSKFCLPIKANAYGHGLIPIAKAAAEAHVDYLGVACLQEGVLLRNAGINIPILVLGAIHENQIPDLLEYNLEFTISSLFKAKMVATECKKSQKKCKVHVEIDTGMQRTGVRPETAIELLNYLYSEHCFNIVGLYSHLATSDDPNNSFTQQQINLFQNFIDQYELKKKNPGLICHISNSGGLCYFPKSYMDMVRPGLLTFGYFPGPPIEALQEIKPIFSVKANIGFFKVVDSNQGISYGHTYRTTEQTRVVTIPIGYGDGLRRELSNRGHVLIQGLRYSIAGTICMDQFMVDIHKNEAYVGDEVVLIGTQGNNQITLEEMAKLCNTITYEILCGFNNRLPRYYHDIQEGKTISFTG